MMSVNMEGEMEIIVLKIVLLVFLVVILSWFILWREFLIVLEVWEIIILIKVLLKILNSYYKRLRKEDDDNNLDFVGIFLVWS